MKSTFEAMYRGWPQRAETDQTVTVFPIGFLMEFLALDEASVGSFIDLANDNEQCVQYLLANRKPS